MLRKTTAALWFGLLFANTTLADESLNLASQATNESLTEAQRMVLIRRLSELDYTPSLLTQSDRDQDLFFLPLSEFSGNVLFRHDPSFPVIARAVEEGDTQTLLNLYHKDSIAGATQDLLHAMLLLLNSAHDSFLSAGEVTSIKKALDNALHRENVDLTSAFASVALSSYYLGRQEYRPALDSIMRGITLLPAFVNVSEHEATLVTLAANYQLAAFYYALRDMKSAADTYQDIIYEGSAYISDKHQAAHTRRLIDVLFQQKRYKEALPHAERLLNQPYSEPALKAKAQYIYGKLLVAMNDASIGQGYFNDIMLKRAVPAEDRVRACRALYQLSHDENSLRCIEKLIDNVGDPEFWHFWHKLNYLRLIDSKQFDEATPHIKAMLMYVRKYMDEVVSRQSQRLLLEYNVDMAKKQAAELKLELKLKQDYLTQSERNEYLYNFMIGIVAVVFTLGVLFFIRERKNSKRMHKMAMTDTLTRMPNRRAILEKIEKRAGNHTNELPWVIAILDLDHFKHINDTYGHDGGDAVLQLFSQACQNVLPDNAVVGRYGGEEFLLLMENAEQASVIAFFHRLQAALEQQTITVAGAEHTLTVTVSAGAACVYPKPDVEIDAAALDQIIKMTDDNVYQAKANGRNNLIVTRYPQDRG